MLFVDHELAAHFEGVNARGNRDYITTLQARFPDLGASTLRVSGGWATHDGPGMLNAQVVGWGMAGSVPLQEIEAVEHFFADRHSPVTVELCPFADRGLIEALGRRGYRYIESSLLTGCELGDKDAGFTPADGIEVRLARHDEAELWGSTIHRGFTGETSPGDLALKLVGGMFQRAGSPSVVAFVDGEPAGAAMLTIVEDTAFLRGASTLPAFRGRGVHSAMIRFRLAEAVSAGCRWALFDPMPGTPSLRNGLRAGLTPLYPHVMLRKDVG